MTGEERSMSDAELDRRFNDIIAERRETLANTTAAIKVVSEHAVQKDVYTLQIQQVNKEVGDMKKSLDDLSSKVELTAQAQAKTLEQQQQSRRFYVASVLFPTLMFLATVVSIIVTRHA